MLFTCATDKTVAVWDTEVGVRLRKLIGHQSFVNSVCPARRGPQYLCSGSDDGTVKVRSLYLLMLKYSFLRFCVLWVFSVFDRLHA
jgi:WD40 repeat protein